MKEGWIALDYKKATKKKKKPSKLNKQKLLMFNILLWAYSQKFGWTLWLHKLNL